MACDRPRAQSQRSAGALVHAPVRHPEATAAAAADHAADEAFAKGTDAGETADKYIRDTVFLATVLFLVGISGHFRVVQARLGLIGIGAALLVFSVIQLLGLPARRRVARPLAITPFGRCARSALLIPSP